MAHGERVSAKLVFECGVQAEHLEERQTLTWLVCFTAISAAEKELRAAGSSMQKDVVPDWSDVSGHNSKHSQHNVPNFGGLLFNGSAKGAARAFPGARLLLGL